ncbi:single-stranded DNA-binding protein (TIGR00621) [uncultured Mediterranean phage uvMED]|nr:single-stranded DNA-binding protein (TIGR00621) [uncultured Mediterranean phage uvMED]
MSINNLVFTGNCGKDMEVRHTANGKIVGLVSVALTQGWGENKKTIWVNCEIWGDRAEKLAMYLKKGTPVTVQGELKVDTYESNQGEQKTKIGCKINSVAFSQPKENVDAPRSSSQPPRSSSQPQQESFDDDIPF